MPMNIEMKRNGRILKGGPSGEGWGGQDLNAAWTVAIGEATPDQYWNSELTVGEALSNGQICDIFAFGYGIFYADFLDKDAIPLVKTGRQTVQEDHELGDMVFKKGDEIHSWRD